MISSLFSLLSFLFKPGKVQTLLLLLSFQQTLLSVNLGISGSLFCDLFFLLSSLFSLQTRESANLVAVALFDSRRPRGQQTLLSINLGIPGGLFCDLFSLLSSLFSLQTRESANLVAVALVH